MQKPDGLVVIEPKDLPECLYPLELRDFCGIGRNMESRLRRMGITTARQLCAASRETLRDVWGGIEGERFHDNLRGAVVRRPATQQRTLGHSHILPPALRTEEGAKAVLHRLVQKAAMRLRADHGLAGGMSWFMRFGVDQTWSDEIEFSPTDDTLFFIQTLETLWQRRISLRVIPMAVGITFFGIVAEENHTPSLFDHEEQHRRHCLLQAIDLHNSERLKNGETRNCRIYFGGAHHALDYTPMRIAFNRIPDPTTEN
jgi:DNA polymerase-4